MARTQPIYFPPLSHASTHLVSPLAWCGFCGSHPWHNYSKQGIFWTEGPFLFQNLHAFLLFIFTPFFGLVDTRLLSIQGYRIGAINKYPKLISIINGINCHTCWVWHIYTFYIVVLPGSISTIHNFLFYYWCASLTFLFFR